MTLVCSTCSPASSRVRIATPPPYSCCRLHRFCAPGTCWMLHPLSTIFTGQKVDDRWCSVMMMMSRFLKQDKLHRYVHFALECPSILTVKILIILLGGLGDGVEALCFCFVFFLFCVLLLGLCWELISAPLLLPSLFSTPLFPSWSMLSLPFAPSSRFLLYLSGSAVWKESGIMMWDSRKEP